MNADIMLCKIRTEKTSYTITKIIPKTKLLQQLGKVKWWKWKWC